MLQNRALISLFIKETNMSNSYSGPERRVAERRSGSNERREMVRYEINKSPRRSGKDRRTLYGWGALASFQIK